MAIKKTIEARKIRCTVQGEDPRSAPYAYLVYELPDGSALVPGETTQDWIADSPEESCHGNDWVIDTEDLGPVTLSRSEIKAGILGMCDCRGADEVGQLARRLFCE